MACEQMNRICRTMELDPKYASAIVRRYAASAGGTQDIYVLRGGQKLECDGIYIPTEGDLAFRDGNVNDRQKGDRKHE